MDIKVTRLVTTIGPESWVRATLDRSIAGTLRCGPGKFITSDVTMEDSGDSVTAEIKELAEMGHHDSPPAKPAVNSEVFIAIDNEQTGVTK